MDPRTAIQQLEEGAAASSLPDERFGDRFAGYSVIGLPFRSGHVLALRRFPASSVGPAYTSVWHRDPAGCWTFYSTVPPDLGCTRYFGVAVNRDVVWPIQLTWLGPMQLLVTIPHAVTWELTFAESPASRFMSWMSDHTPDALLRNRTMLKAMGAAAGWIFGAGRMSLAGRTPNGNEFLANAGKMWLVESSRAIIRGCDIGDPGPLHEQARLRDVWIPQRGLLAVTRACLAWDRL